MVEIDMYAIWRFRFCVVVMIFSCVPAAQGADLKAAMQGRHAVTRDSSVQDLKKEVLELSRDLTALEQELFFPPSSAVTVFVSLDIGAFFTLQSVELKVDDRIVASHIYADTESEALKRGGVQRLFMGNYGSGTHQLVAYFIGTGPHERPYQRAVTHAFTKTTQPTYIEFKITDEVKKQQPEFVIREWN